MKKSKMITTYRDVHPGRKIVRQKQLTECIILDLDEDGEVVGIEAIGPYTDTELLFIVLGQVKF